MTTQLNSSMMRILGVTVSLMVLMPGIALAQSPRQPVVELGAQVSNRSDVAPVVGALSPIRRADGGNPPTAPALATTIQDAKPQNAGPMLPPAAWRRVKPGREVWVRTNTGSLVHGDLAAISDSSLNIREQDGEVTIRLDDVRLIEGRDSIKNGLLTGGASGAVAGGLLVGVAVSTGCEYECHGAAGAFLTGAVGGAVIGGLLGMMVDGLIPGRQTLFEGSTTVVTPVITPTGKAVNVGIRWR